MPKPPAPTAGELSTMVVRVQTALMRMGYYKGDIDGVLGPQTRTALIDFQRARGIGQSGRMDIDTLTGLGITVP